MHWIGRGWARHGLSVDRGPIEPVWPRAGGFLTIPAVFRPFRSLPSAASMGREAKLLLAVLGLLTGVLAGVVSMKLFVPRPPTGAGPDIHGASAATEVQDLVEPPALSLPQHGDFEPADATALPASRFTTRSQPPADSAWPEEAAVRDRFVSPASFDVSTATPLDAPTDLLPPAAVEPLPPLAESTPVPAPVVEEPTPAFVASPPSTFVAAPPAAEPLPPSRHEEPHVSRPGEYVARPGDSWWSLAERTYGDGRFYRALFAWNRAHDPRISLVPGTRLELPPVDRLTTAWPNLMPPAGTPH